MNTILTSVFLPFFQAFSTFDADEVETVTLRKEELVTELQMAEKALNQHEPWVNAKTHERWTPHVDSAAYWEMYEAMAPGGFVNVSHIHPRQAETVCVLQGAVRCLLHNKWRVLRAGEMMVVPAGVSHALVAGEGESEDEGSGGEEISGGGGGGGGSNSRSSDGRSSAREPDVLMRVRYTPSVPHMSTYFACLAALSRRARGMTAGGVPHPLYCALLFRLAPDLVHFWWFPPAIMHLYAMCVAPIASFLGYSLDDLLKEKKS